MSTIRVVLTRQDDDGKYLVHEFEDAHTRIIHGTLYMYRRPEPPYAHRQVLAAFPRHTYLYWIAFD